MRLGQKDYEFHMIVDNSPHGDGEQDSVVIEKQLPWFKAFYEILDSPVCSARCIDQSVCVKRRFSARSELVHNICRPHRFQRTARALFEHNGARCGLLPGKT